MKKKLQILGTGCPKCRQLTAQVETAAQAMGLDYEIEKVTDINQILSFGVMMTPALAVDGEVRLIGVAPSTQTIINALDDLRTMEVN